MGNGKDATAILDEIKKATDQPGPTRVSDGIVMRSPSR